MRYLYNISRSAVRAFNQHNGSEARRREHQIELAKEKREEGLALYSGTFGDENGVGVGVTQKDLDKVLESYNIDSHFPLEAMDLMVVVDVQASTVVLPIMGRPVPFHIKTIRNANMFRPASKGEGESASLRINFFIPGDKGRRGDWQSHVASSHFLQSLTFKSQNFDRMEDLARQINEMRRASIRQEQEKKDPKDVIEKEKLVEMPNQNSHRLYNVFARPSLVIGGKRRKPGEVEIHRNGLRYCDPRGGNIDVLFSNVEHLFFQPSKYEPIVIIHVHLKNPITIGKKNVKDVQFYREITDTQLEEIAHRKRMNRRFPSDDDELELEQEQELRRQRVFINKQFKAFAKKIQSAGCDYIKGIDVPFRELGFRGVPYRTNMLCQPTAGCLVQLNERPFLVLTLEDVEIVYLERVQFRMKNFDMVCVFKDFRRPPLQIRHIPLESLESVKAWLDLVNIVFYQGPGNFKWRKIMEEIVRDTYVFYDRGGWAFLSMGSDDEDRDEDTSSTFEMSRSDWEESSSDRESGD